MINVDLPAFSCNNIIERREHCEREVSVYAYTVHDWKSQINQGQWLALQLPRISLWRNICFILIQNSTASCDCNLWSKCCRKEQCTARDAHDERNDWRGRGKVIEGPEAAMGAVWRKYGACFLRNRIHLWWIISQCFWYTMKILKYWDYMQNNCNIRMFPYSTIKK